VSAPDPALTPNAGLAAITELCGRLGVIGALDAAVGPIKQCERGFGAGELLAGLAAAQLAGEDFLTGLDRQRADAAGLDVGRAAHRDHGRLPAPAHRRHRRRGYGHGVRGGKAMIATLRWRLIAVPGRLVRHARHLVLRLPPGHSLLPEILARLRELPVPA
jgi:hypothetical protein